MSDISDITSALELAEVRLVEFVRAWLALPAAERQRLLQDGEPADRVVARLRAAHRDGALPARVVQALDAIPEWCWSCAQEQSASYLEAVERFVRDHGIENLVCSTVSEGLPIGRWLNSQRHYYRKGRVPPWLRTRLERIPGWSPTRGPKLGREHRTRQTIQRHLQALRQQIESGRSISDIDDDTRGGLFRSIHNYFVRLKGRGELPDVARRELDAMPGWTWAKAGAFRHRDILELLQAAVARGDRLQFNTKLVIDGVEVGRWIRSCQERHRGGRLSNSLEQALVALPGWQWSPDRRERHHRNLGVLRRTLEHVNLDELVRHPIHEGVNLWKWVTWVRGARRRGQLAEDIAAALEALPGWTWDPRIAYSPVFAAKSPSEPLPTLGNEQPFDRRGRTRIRRGITVLEAEYIRLITGYLGTGARTLASKSAVHDGVRLKQPVDEFRRQYAEGLISPDVAAKLEAIPGWTWSPVEERFERNFELVRRFIAEHGIDALTQGTVIDGEPIGRWLSIQRQQYQRRRLAPRWRTMFEKLAGWKGNKGRVGLSRYVARQTIARHLDALEANARGERTLSTKKQIYLRHYFLKQIAKGRVTQLERSRFDAAAGQALETDEDVKRKYLTLLRKLAGEQGLPDLTSGVIVDGERVGNWAVMTCKRYREGRLDAWLIRELESIPGWIWKSSRAEVRAKKLRLLEKYLSDHDIEDLWHHPIFEGVNLYNMVRFKRTAYHKGILSDDEIRFLECLPAWSWSPREDDRKRKPWRKSDPVDLADDGGDGGDADDGDDEFVGVEAEDVGEDADA